MQRAEVGGFGVARVVLVEDAVQRDVLAHHRIRHGLGDLVAEGVRKAQGTGGVLDRGLGLDGAVRDDLRDLIGPVLLRGVADHLAAPTLVEVHVDVRHRHAVRVQEPLEDQTVLDRVEFGDPQRPCDERAGRRTTPGTHADPVLLGVTHEVSDDKEVTRVPHLVDDRDLVIGLQTVLVGDRVRGESRLKSAHDLLGQPRLLGLPLGNVEPRHEVGGIVELDVAPLRDQQCVVAGLGQLRPHRTHLLGGLEEVARAVEPEPFLVVDRGPGTDAQQDVVRLGVLLPHIVQVVGGDQWQIQGPGDLEQVLPVPTFDVEAVVHQFAVEVACAQDVAEVGRRRQRLVVLPGAQPHVHLATGAPGGGDESLAELVQQFAVEARLAVVALDAGQARHPEEVVHALRGLGQHRHVGVGLLALGGGDTVLTDIVAGYLPEVVRRPGVPALWRVVPLDPDDRLDPVLLALLVELVGAEHVAVVSHGDRRHPEARGLGEQVVESGGAVQHRVLGMHMKVHERVRHGSPQKWIGPPD